MTVAEAGPRTLVEAGASPPAISSNGAASRPVPTTSVAGIIIGRLVDVLEDGRALVEYEDRAPVPARMAMGVGRAYVGGDVALVLDAGGRPFVLGPVVAGATSAPRPAAKKAGTKERLVLDAKREIVLRCGDASITLTRAGKILLRGAYLLSRSSGANKIKGASVQIN